MKYLTNFKTKEEYNSFKDSSNYIYPNISYIEDSGSVINKSPQIQEKQVEITENGEITITPDAGFAYLNSVKVKTNVPTSGGGSEDTMEYFISKDAGKYEEVFWATASYGKAQIANDPVGVIIAPLVEGTKDLVFDADLVIALGVDFKQKFLFLQDNTTKEMTLMDYLSSLGVPVDIIANIPQITKEEFFTLPTDVTVKYKDQEKLKEVYEGIVDLYIRRGLPIYGRTREYVDLEEPIIYFNYGLLGVEYDEFGDVNNPTHLLMYGIGQQGYPENDWNESFSESEDISYDYLEFNSCYIFKVTLPNGEVVYTFKGKPA